MKSVEFHPGAQTDYDESFDWYAARSRQAAMLFATAVDESLGRIQRDPSLFHALDSQHRECLLKRCPFRIIFRIMGDRVIVIAVAHAKRRPGYWRNRVHD